MRFRKSFKLLPGIRLNFSKKGFSSVSIGRPGATLNLGRRGAYVNVGLPGTGISHQEKLFGPSRQTSQTRSVPRPKSQPALRPSPLPTRPVQLPTAQEQNSARLSALTAQVSAQNLIYGQAIRQRDKIKNPLELVAEYLRPPQTEPEFPLGWLALTILGFLFCGFFNFNPIIIILAVILLIKPILLLIKYFKEFYTRENEVKKRKDLLSKAKYNDIPAMEEILSTILNEMGHFWFQANVSFDLELVESAIYLDVDLPEIETFPQVKPVVVKSRLTIENQPKTSKEINIEYQIYVLSLTLRLANLIFAFFGQIATATISLYTQRIVKDTNKIGDDYVLSVVFDRARFDRLDKVSLDPAQIVLMFEPRIIYLPDGSLGSIEPFAKP
ncbi:MAG: DUF4236 domain-containing protein [Deltaproteobacteria bacterium]|jgi:hypothetical protein|nr:DUF4236 domain-containing protein [Deltaproteobacteria bacterium]